MLRRWQGHMNDTVSFCECTLSGGHTQRWWGLVVWIWHHDQDAKTYSLHCLHPLYPHTRTSHLVKLSLANILYLYHLSGHVISSIPLRSPVTFAFNAHFGPVYSVDSSPYHRNLFITCSSDNTARVYSMLQVRIVCDIVTSDFWPRSPHKLNGPNNSHLPNIREFLLL